ncbi:MFS transporter [Agromyces intestinalis]|uniref:MFS transporter n=1 Tax=Agromyces intestinalis TaxID=2592652 RepID=A0A5C1YBI9_9MICO|nr:MFS transporter [Agromyces intestinalis]QEO13000.1 MFS transporter [Agromyces intestinalis]
MIGVTVTTGTRSEPAVTAVGGSPAPPAESRFGGRALGLLAVLCGAAFLEGVDIAMFSVALPVIRAELGLATGELQWVVSAYILGYGGFMLLGGRAADLLGRRRVFLVAMAVFLAFSGLGGMATESWMLLTARAVTGIAAAFMMPAGLSIITTSFEEGHARTRALLIYAGIGAAGFSIGLVAGGLLTMLGWRWVFFAPVLVTAVLLALAIPLVPREPAPADGGRGGRRRVDVAGAVTITAAFLLLITAVEQSTHASPVVTTVIAAASVGLFAAFVAIERRAPEPLIPLGFLRRTPLLRAYLAAASLAAGFIGFQFIVVLYLQEFRGWSALETSVALLVLGIDAVLAPTLTPRLVARFGLWPVILGGLVAAAASFLLFVPVGPDWTYAAMFPSFLALGLAFTFAYGPLTVAATARVDDADQGLSGGLLYTAFQFGAAIGLAATSAVLMAVEGRGAVEASRIALVVPIAASVIGIGVGVVAVGRRARARG